MDLEHCATLHDGKVVPTDPAQVLGALGIGAANRDWNGGDVETQTEKGERFQYLVVFKRPVKIGALLCEKRGDWQVIDRSVFTLKAGAAVEPNASDKSQWEPVLFPSAQSGCRLATFAPGFATRAILTEEICRQGGSSLGTLRAFIHRLHNLVPVSSATAPSEYTAHSALAPAYTYSAENITTGAGRWESAGKEDGVVRGAAITPGNPSWFVVQWEQTQRIVGLWLDDNFTKTRFRAYVGPEGINPVIGNDDEWGRIKYEERSAIPGRRRERLVQFEQPVKTRSIKLDILETPRNEIQIARIAGLHILTDLGDAPEPQMKVVEAPPPFKVRYDLPREGMTTGAIDGPDGRRVRNLFAREQRRQGANEEAWDLKDEQGHPVAPGKYKLKVLCNPGIHLNYQMTPYPNIGDNSPENSAWLNGESGSGGWLADHTSCTSICAAGDRIYVGAPVSESGVSLIECDLTGRKYWGHANFLAWTGPHFLAADDTYVYSGMGPNYPEHGDTVFRTRRNDKQDDRPIDLPGDGHRKRQMVGLAVRDGLVYIAVNAHEDAFANAAAAEDVDLDHSFPTYPRVDRHSHDTPATWIPDRRSEFPAMFRMGDQVPGHRGLINVETDKVAAARQHVVLAFKKAMPIGSLVFPMSHQSPMRLSLLKPTVTGVPDPSDESQWEQIWQSPKKGDWTVIPVPKNTQTRALRLTFARLFDEIEDVLSTGSEKVKDKDPTDLLGTRGGDDKQDAWVGSIEGMKILRRRFQSLAPIAHVSVNSGAISEVGEWDAKRTEPLSEEKPGIYAMQWDQPRKVRGLAIKEIDGRLTQIDVWNGPENGSIDIASEKGWKNVATYEQKRRKFGAVEAGLGPNNDAARYLDGYVDLGTGVTTRAIRLRVVAQWTNNGVGQETRLGIRDDRGGQALNASRCRIYGVAPLEMIGDEVPVDPLIAQRVEVWDTREAKAAVDRTGKPRVPAIPATLVTEVPFVDGGQIALGPDGNLFGISGNQVVEVSLNATAGEPPRTVISDVILPQALTVDSKGQIYVLDNAPDRKVIRMYDAAGKFLRQFGHPGGYQVGPWDPQRIDWATAIAVDKNGQLWHTESSYWPKRIVCWDTNDGTVKKQFLGNTQYGGGGVLDPHDKHKMYYGPLEFELDWETGKTRLKNLTWRGTSTAGEIPAYVNDRQYMLTHANGAIQPDAGAATVYLYEKDHSRAVAAMGPASGYPPFQEAAFQIAYAKKFGTKSMMDQRFLWTDANGDGQIQVDEVQFSPVPPGPFHTCYFDTSDLSLSTTSRFRYEVKSFLPDGAPVYIEKAYPKLPAEPNIRLADGNFIFMMEGDDQVWRNARFTPEGKEIWGYRNEGFSGFAYPRATPWAPSKVVAEFDVVGTGKSRAGDLGEFFVENDNVGQWNVYSADGMLAGWIFLEIRNPARKGWSMPEHQRGLALDDVTVGQEHFQGYFCQSADGKYYVVAGHNHATVVEVTGLDQFKRVEREIEVTPDDLKGIEGYDHTLYQRLACKNVKVLDVHPLVKPLQIDASDEDWKEQAGGAELPGINFKAAFGDRYLYVIYVVRGHGPLKNVGTDWHTLFRTGACVDLLIGADPKADPKRPEPVQGDMRVLMSVVGDKPIAVLYQPVNPGAPESEHKEFHTGVAHCAFDRVVQLEDAHIAHRAWGDGYVIEAALPLSTLGLKIADGTRMKLDWGILQSGAGGSEVLDHLWWSNKVPLPFDEAAEARLHPDLWGYARFTTRTRNELEGPLHTAGVEDKAGKKRPDEIEDELDKGSVK